MDNINPLDNLNSSLPGQKAQPLKLDPNLQIYVPTPGEAPNLEETHTFKNVMARYLGEVNTLQHDADTQVQKLAAGEVENLHEVTMAMDEADTAFQLMMSIRNKLESAYQQVINMQ